MALEVFIDFVTDVLQQFNNYMIFYKNNINTKTSQCQTNISLF